MLGGVSALFLCLRSVVDASLPTHWETDKAFRIHLLSLFFINVGDLSALLSSTHGILQ